ncbi:GDP-fucose protein O-fucosyltransferase 2, partial [Asbolus verrucosus]
MRFAVLAHKLKNSKNANLQTFKLVLPPWSHLVHWKRRDAPEQIPWGLFFDLNSLKSFAPVIEMHEFFHAINRTYNIVIDEVYILQHFEDMFETGNFEDRMKLEKCTKNYQINYFFYKNITSHNVKCLSYHGPATKLSKLLEKSPAKTILLHHAEVALHEMFGNALYWQSRRSMRFSKELHQVAADFRKKFLNSTDVLDNTKLPENWRDEKPKRSAKGGPYLSVHLRRRDFLRGRAHQTPSIESVAKQIVELLKKLNLTQVFIATDATDDEYQELIKRIPTNYKILRYKANSEVKMKYKDGGVAIIDQIICSYARHFVGTYESTFSFRIQEEREILGFPAKATFNCLCKDESECPQPSVWKIVY